MSNLTATANGVKFDATTHQAKCVATKTGRIWTIILTESDVRQHGIVAPAGKECLVKCDDQAAFEKWYRANEAAKFQAAQDAKLATIEGQRAALKSAVENAYSPDSFPGSRAYNAYIAAEKALAAFDAVHPEIIAAAQEATTQRNAKKHADYNVWA